MEKFDVIVIGAGAAGMFAAIEAGRRGRSVLVLEHNSKPGEKIRISGGGRCNFTNLHIAPEAYLSANPKFAISALKRYTQWDFIARMDAAGIAWHEKTLGQLFADGSAVEIISMLLDDMRDAGVDLRLGLGVSGLEQGAGGFAVSTQGGKILGQSLIIATGGMSIPKMGATGFGYEVARQFGVPLEPTRAGLVPFTFGPDVLAATKPMAGLSVAARVSTGGAAFEEGFLFTHRGFSGPSILQASSYWVPGREVEVNLWPEGSVFAVLKAASGAKSPLTILADILPRRLATYLCEGIAPGVKRGDLSDAALQALAARVERWRVIPAGTEGYRTAEVTLGGVSVDALSSKTMEVKSVPGLFFIGEVVDVTGWLGGYNFQWAWSSGWAAGQVA